jgi:hypothetical protein
VDCKGCLHKVSDGNKNSAGSWTREHSCYILANNFSTFCLCPETLWKVEFKGDRLINLAEKVSR